MDRIEASANWAIDTFKAEGVEKVFVLGDVLNTRQVVSLSSQSSAWKWFNRLTSSFPMTYVIVGNHDLHLRNSRAISSLDGLLLEPLRKHVTLFKEHTVIHVDGIPVYMLPYAENHQEILKWLEERRKESSQHNGNAIAMGHMSINGAIQSRSQGLKHVGQLGPPSFAHLKRTFTGHFHSHQTIRQPFSDSGSITYIGSPQQFNFSDVNDEKRGVVIYDHVNDIMRHIVNPHAVGFVSIDAKDLAQGNVSKERVSNRYVMMTDSTPASERSLGRGVHNNAHVFAAARDQLLQMGALDVRHIPSATLVDRTKQMDTSVSGAATTADNTIQSADMVTDPSSEVNEEGLSVTGPSSHSEFIQLFLDEQFKVLCFNCV
jgi:DNA repair exonuclease SbcCD nuclease subunit